MSTPPFLTPPRERHRRRPRPGGRALGGGVFALAALAALGAALVLPGGTGREPGAARMHKPSLAIAGAPAPAISPAGYPLSSPAFTLQGITAPQSEELKVPFRRPPRAGMLFDLTSGRVLWQRNAHTRLPIASLTKMMTALLVVRSAPADEPVLITRQAIDTNGSKIGELPLGRHVRLESLLYGLLLPSGNDAAVALALQVAGSVPRFVARMNREAARLGLACTRFSSPHGFYDAGNFSCAADLAVLAHVDLAQPRIARVARTLQAVLPFPIKGGKLYLYNNNPMMLYGYPGITGLKTGYTVASGRCLVATAERHGVRLGVVILNSRDPATQARRLLDDAFARIYHQRPVVEPPFPSGA